jgi:cytochrome P450/NADPH-cytochrome P450 reductase
MLSFLFYFLLKSPSAYKKAQEEVDRVIGKRKITVDDMSKLPYITAVMRETLRLKPTAPMIALHPHPVKNKEDPVTLGGGKYVLHKDETIAVNLSKMQRDPKVYGPDADEFKPERMLDENFEKLPKNAWKPFGNGMRGCIGRPFAWQEALLVVAVLLQNFNFQMDNPSYDLRIKQTLTIKPKDFHMKATLRDGLDPTQLNTALSGSAAPPTETGAGSRDRKPKVAPVDGKLKPMHVFYGSNTGTCEAFARRLADDATGYGYAAQTSSLDSAMQNIPKDGPVVLISASYEGQPPDNAAHFFEWLSELKGNSLEGVNYAAFGCGHHDWASTFYRVPKIIDQLVKDNGANKLCDIGLVDAANSDMFTDFDSWGESSFWPAVMAKFGGVGPEKAAKSKSSLQVEVSSGMRASTLGLQLEEGFVIENQLLTPPGAPAKRIVKFKLPSDMSYQCGDYLAVLPVNPSSIVRRAIRRFDLPWDAVLRVQKPSGSTASPSIPIDTPISAFELLSTYIELSQPASKRDLNVLADAAVHDAEAQAELRYLASSPSRFTEEIVKKRVSPLDLLTRYPTIKLPIGDFLAMLPPMRVRQYSISSSPLLNPSECSITFGVLSAPALANTAEATEDPEQYLGVASNYLSELQVGERAHITVRPSHSGFKPPMDLETPMIMACAGSGLAPFRGFVMDRAEKIRGRRSTPDSDELHEHESFHPAKAVLYIGCRTQGLDDIHATELAEWAKLGAVDVRWAYSRPADGSRGQHVQDLMLEDREDLVRLFDQGANIYVCGSTGVGAGVRGACKKMYLEKRRAKHAELRGKGETPPGAEIDEDRAAEEFFENLRTKERYATDVFT